MDEQEPRKRQTINTFGRVARDRRIFERAREGFPFDQIGREEGLSAERVRQIVVNHREGKSRKAVRAAPHARLQPIRVARDEPRFPEIAIKILIKLDNLPKFSPTSSNDFKGFPNFSKPEPNLSKFSFEVPKKA